MGGVSGSAAVSVLREVFTRCDSNILGASGCTGDSVFMGAVWLFGTVDSKSLMTFLGKQQRILFVLLSFCHGCSRFCHLSAAFLFQLLCLDVFFW